MSESAAHGIPALFTDFLLRDLFFGILTNQWSTLVGSGAIKTGLGLTFVKRLLSCLRLYTVQTRPEVAREG